MKFVYIRVSTDAGDQEAKNQLRDIEVLSGPDYTLFEELQSAWKDKDRPIFDSIKARISKGQVKDLYVWDLDRLYRRRESIVEFLRFCKVYKCNVHSFRQNWLEEIYKIPNPWNEIISDLLHQVMGWMAEEESNKKSERVKMAIRKTGNQTLSYKGNKWGRKAIPEEKVLRIIELLSQKKSMREIALELKLSKSAVHKYIQKSMGDKILKNPNISISQ